LHRALFVVVPLLIVLTAAWRYRQHVRAEYPLTAERGRTEGIPALEDGDFDKAFQLLAPAKKAVVALGGAVENADEITNAADEAAIFVHLIPQTLEELLDEAGRDAADSWSSRFETLYKGRSIIIDSWIAAEPDPSAGSGYDIEYRVLPPGQPSNFVEGGGSRPDRVGRIDLIGFKLLELAQLHVGEPVKFGAKLASFKRERDEWVIRFEPGSGVFILHPKSLQTIGWPRGPDADVPLRNRP
jgi:hypothetical protein